MFLERQDYQQKTTLIFRMNDIPNDFIIFHSAIIVHRWGQFSNITNVCFWWLFRGKKSCYLLFRSENVICPDFEANIPRFLGRKKLHMPNNNPS